MEKEVKEIKGNCLKAAEKKTEVKEGKFLEGKHICLLSQEKQKAVIKQKQHLLNKGGRSF